MILKTQNKTQIKQKSLEFHGRIVYNSPCHEGAVVRQNVAVTSLSRDRRSNFKTLNNLLAGLLPRDDFCLLASIYHGLEDQT